VSHSTPRALVSLGMCGWSLCASVLIVCVYDCVCALLGTRAAETIANDVYRAAVPGTRAAETIANDALTLLLPFLLLSHLLLLPLLIPSILYVYIVYWNCYAV